MGLSSHSAKTGAFKSAARLTDIVTPDFNPVTGRGEKSEYRRYGSSPDQLRSCRWHFLFPFAFRSTRD